MIELPYPPSILNPNRKAHWSLKAKSAREYKRTCWAFMAQYKPEMTLKFSVQFCPPDNRRRDRDNTIAAFKSGQDGMAAYWHVDDSEFEITYLPFGAPVKHGKVIICTV